METVAIAGGFKIRGSAYDLIVGVPSELGQLLASVGVRNNHSSTNDISEAKIRTAITKFMGDCDKYGLYNCVLLRLSKEEEDEIREELEVADDDSFGNAFQQSFHDIKAFHRWDPELTTVVRDAAKGKTTVTFKDDDEAILAEVVVFDELEDSDESDDSDE
jgi:hypothetical protein